jgi:RNase adapter protein RapZ
MELVLVTGMSGAGRRSVLSALEDSGSAALDNVPVHLLEPLLDLETRLNPSRPRLAVGMDNRHVDFAGQFLQVLDHLQDGNLSTYLVFVDADDAALVRRYSESRRPHFLALEAGSVAAAVARERGLVRPIKERADAILDTTRYTLSQLRQRMSELLPEFPIQGTTLRLLSFGFKFGLPAEADMVLDARFLPNPHYVADLKPLTGRDAPVRDFLMKSDAFNTFVALAENWILWSWPLIQQEARAYHTIAFGCTGGQHRSVALAEILAQRLRREIPKLMVQHREITR